jgi:hypothetical protein
MESIFEVMAKNILTINDNLSIMYKEIHEIHEALYPKEQPKTAGDAQYNEVSGND